MFTKYHSTSITPLYQYACRPPPATRDAGRRCGEGCCENAGQPGLSLLAVRLLDVDVDADELPLAIRRDELKVEHDARGLGGKVAADQQSAIVVYFGRRIVDRRRFADGSARRGIIALRRSSGAHLRQPWRPTTWRPRNCNNHGAERRPANEAPRFCASSRKRSARLRAVHTTRMNFVIGF